MNQLPVLVGEQDAGFQEPLPALPHDALFAFSQVRLGPAERAVGDGLRLHHFLLRHPDHPDLHPFFEPGLAEARRDCRFGRPSQ